MNDPTLLHTSVERGDLSLVESILAASPDLRDATDGDGNPPLLIAARRGDRAMVSLLRKHGASLDVQATGAADYLCDAAFHGDNEAVCLLVELGCNVDDGRDDYAPVVYAVQGVADWEKPEADDIASTRETVRLLLSLGANPQPALEYAVRHDSAPALRLLFELGLRDDSLLLEAASRGCLEAVRALIESGHDLAVRGTDGRTPLHHCADGMDASDWNGTEIALELIRAGANVDAVDGRSATPLLYAAWGNAGSAWERAAQGVDYARLATCLIENGASVHHATNDGVTALHLAAKGVIEVIPVLLEAGANVRSRDVAGLTPREVATEEGCEEAAKYLEAVETDELHDFFCSVEQGHLSDVDDFLSMYPCLAYARDRAGRTALHLSVLVEDLAQVILLLEAGVNLQAIDLNGDTACSLAESLGYAEIAQVLAS